MTTFKIEIPEPCHENWSAMSVEERGRHCSVCNKVVVDFTKDSPEQFNNKLKEYHSARTDVCGRFNDEQITGLSKKKYHIIEFGKLELNPFQRFLFAFAFAFFLGGFESCKVGTTTMGVARFGETGGGVSAPQHLKNFEKDCGSKDTGPTMGSVVIVPDTAAVITVAPMHHMEFQKDSFNLTKETMLFLDGLADSLRSSRNYSVEVIGHTDSKGGEQLNKELSLKRATSVKTYLEQKGIKVDICRGVSYQYPVATNDTEEGRAKNRRVEVLVGRKKKTP